MTQDQIFQWLVAIIGSLLAWGAKNVCDSVNAIEIENRRLDDRINGLEILLASNYVRNDRYDATVSALFAKMDRIEDKQDRSRDMLEEIRESLADKVSRDELKEGL